MTDITMAGAPGLNAYELYVVDYLARHDGNPAGLLTQLEWMEQDVGIAEAREQVVLATQQANRAATAADAPQRAIAARLAYSKASTTADNLLDFTKVQEGYVNANGVLEAFFAHLASPMIPVVPGLEYRSNRVLVWNSGITASYYRIDGTFLSNAPQGGYANGLPVGAPLVPPAGAAYLRCNLENKSAADVRGWAIWQGTVDQEPQNAFATLSRGSDVAAVAAQFLDALLPADINLFDQSTVTVDRIVRSLAENGQPFTDTGTLADSSGFGAGVYYTSDWINVAAYRGQSITIVRWNNADVNGNFGLAFYDERKIAGDATYNEGWQQGAPATLTIAVPPYATWMRFSGRTVELPNTMVVPGTTAPSGYVPFGIRASSQVSPASASPLNGKRIGVWGDSYSAEDAYHSVWQNELISRTGAVGCRQDARGGRTWAQALEGYGAPSPLASIGQLTGYNPNYVPAGLTITLGDINTTWDVPEAGATLEEVLAPLDVLIVYLGTNDVAVFGTNIGQPSDSYTAGTFWAAARFVMDAFTTAAPRLPIVLVGPCFLTEGAWGDPERQTAITSATQAVGSRYGAPVLNGRDRFGINSINAAQNLRDGLHPTDAKFRHIGRLIGSFVEGCV